MLKNPLKLFGVDNNFLLVYYLTERSFSEKRKKAIKAMKKEKTGETQRDIQAKKRRKQLLDTALWVFAEHGYDRTSIKDLAEEAGVSQGLIYHYFDSKENLLEEIVSSHSLLPQMRNIIEKSGKQGFEDVLGEMSASFYKLLQSKKILVSIFVRESATNPKVFRVWKNMVSEGIKILEDYIASRIEKGELKKHNPNITARMLVYNVFMLNFTKYVFTNESVGAEGLIEESVKYLLEGIKK